MSSDRPIDPGRLEGMIDFLQSAAALKDTLRTGRTASGRRESSADHSWRLCLMAMLLADDLEGVDLVRLLQLCVVHDLAEAVTGDVPAPCQAAGDGRKERERDALRQLCGTLPEDLRQRIQALCAEYDAGASPESLIAKGLDKIETMLQHLIGANPPGFDYRFNLSYGRRVTDRHPILR
ncbi:MAG TPA: HD domain-containing protein, partial [Allosphingosinicella sp.]